MAGSSTKKSRKEDNPEVPVSPFTLADGSMLKLGVFFTHKSYIMHKKAASEEKWPLLVACEEGMAWRHEKGHIKVITTVWCKLADLAAVPSKKEAGDTRQQVLNSQASA